MKKLILVFLLLPLLSVAQSNDLMMKVEVKPIDPKKGYTFELHRAKDEIRIEYKKVDSVGAFSFREEDKKIISRLIAKTDIDSMTKDSIDYYQKKMDKIKEANTFYKQDNVSIYKTTHKNYFKFLESLLKTPDSILVEPQGKILASTYCFVTIKEGNLKDERTFYVECLEPKIFPILAKLVNDTNEIVKAHKAVMGKRN